MTCHKPGLWGITAPSNPAKWAIFPISGAAVRQTWAINSRVNLWPWLHSQLSIVSTPLGPSESHVVTKVKHVRWTPEIIFSYWHIGLPPLCSYLISALKERTTKVTILQEAHKAQLVTTASLQFSLFANKFTKYLKPLKHYSKWHLQRTTNIIMDNHKVDYKRVMSKSIRKLSRSSCLWKTCKAFLNKRSMLKNKQTNLQKNLVKIKPQNTNSKQIWIHYMYFRIPTQVSKFSSKGSHILVLCPAE